VGGCVKGAREGAFGEERERVAIFCQEVAPIDTRWQ